MHALSASVMALGMWVAMIAYIWGGCWFLNTIRRSPFCYRTGIREFILYPAIFLLPSAIIILYKLKTDPFYDYERLPNGNRAYRDWTKEKA